MQKTLRIIMVMSSNSLETNTVGKLKASAISIHRLDLLIFPRGLGLYLKALAHKEPARYDLHEPHRLIQSLTAYEHLHRVFRLCVIHVHRNIAQCAVPETVRSLMRSLICTTHSSWDLTLHRIQEEGGQAGRGNCIFYP